MAFSSLIFLYVFLPVSLLLCLAAPKPLKNAALLLCSLAFYGWAEPKCLPVMLLTILAGFFGALAVSRAKTKRGRQVWLWGTCTVCLGVLVYFKYTYFFLTTLGFSIRSIALPAGVSFYTFQLLSYVIDVYRGAAPQSSLIDFGAYIAMFPQLVAGPIVRYSDIAGQLRDRRVTADGLYAGARRFLVGLGKKILLADQLALLCKDYRAMADPSALLAWLYAIGFTLEIYLDFSGYSDMAIGLGQMLGFSFPENFQYPYLSRSIREFWRRWHISLGAWFRDYVYIPLGGNRVSRGKWVRNILLVWGLTGLWHGAGWNFLLWGLLFGVLLLGEGLLWGKALERHRVLSRVYTLFFVVLGFVLFNADNLAMFAQDARRMFCIGTVPARLSDLYDLRNYAVVLLLALIGATPAAKRLYDRAAHHPAVQWAESLGLLALLLLCTAALVDGSFNPFLYFRF